MLRRLFLSLIATTLLAPLPANAERTMPVRGVTLASLHRGDNGYGSDGCREQLRVLAEMGCNWVALCDFAWMESVREPGVRYRAGRSPEGNLAQTVRDAHAAGIQVMLKPHLWSRDFGNGVDWHGTIEMGSEEEWARFFENYTTYLVGQATIAEATNADALCLGVEMRLASHRDADWRKLIAEVRKVYRGKLTYAANNDEFERITWWDAVDCIGITAYFPLSEERPATEAQVRESWNSIYGQRLDALAARFNKPIVFAELGYSASASAAAAPWEHHEVAPIDLDYQAMLYRVALEEASKRDYMAGVFLWKWFTADAETAARLERNDVFGLQNRTPTLTVLREQWQQAPPPVAVPVVAPAASVE